MRRMTLAIATIGFVVATSLTAAAPLDDAKTLLKQGKAAESMELLEKQLPQLAQDVEFNYLLGIASLDAGKPGNAVFAFERALAVDPNHLQARAELARALIALTEYEAARRELTQVQQAPLPPEVAARVTQLLAQLDAALAEQAGKGTRVFTGYIEGEIGYDTNINTATNFTSVFIPALNLPGTLSGFSTAQASSLIGLNGGVFGQVQVKENVDVYANLDARFRYHPSQEDFSTGALMGGAGVRVTRGIDQFSIGLTQFTYYIDQYRNDDQLGVYGQWQRELSRQDMVGLFGQYVHVNHPIAPFLNTNLYLGGGIWTHAFMGAGEPLLRLIAYVGDDRERNDDPTVGRQFVGVKAAGEYRLREGLKLFGSVAGQNARYGGENVFFATKRKDWRYDLNAGIAYKPAREWTVSAQLLYTRNDSNIEINDFDRKQVLVTVRRDFF